MNKNIIISHSFPMDMSAKTDYIQGKPESVVHLDPPIEKDKKITFEDIFNMLYEWSDLDKVLKSYEKKYDYTNPDVYRDEKYQRINPKTLNIIVDKAKETYNTLYNQGSWFNFKPKFLNDSKHRDPVFAQKVKIDSPTAKIMMIGDLHSGLHSFHQILGRTNVRQNFFIGDTLKLHESRYIFFLGDIVDRGPWSIELITIILFLKILNPNNVFIINGNHEDCEMYSSESASAGFGKELINQYYDGEENIEGSKDCIHFGKMLWFLPSVIYLNFIGKTYHLSHGAFDQKFTFFDSNIQVLKEFISSNYDFFLLSQHDPDNNFKWGDFDQKAVMLLNKYGEHRLQFGYTITKLYLEIFGIQSIISGHQDFVSLGLMVRDENKTTFRGQKFTMCSKLPPKRCNFEVDLDYNLYVPDILHTIEMKNDVQIQLDPNSLDGGDFMALVTSSAVISKLLRYNTYLIMENDKPIIEDYVPARIDDTLIDDPNVKYYAKSLDVMKGGDFYLAYVDMKKKYLQLRNKIIRN